MTKFASAPTSFPNDAAGSHCQATRSRIGSRRDGSFYQSSTHAEPQNAKAMQRAFANLARALRDRLDIIHDEDSRRDKAKHVARLRAVSQKIDELEAALPQPIEARLKHYLERRSYGKALEYLEDRDD